MLWFILLILLIFILVGGFAVNHLIWILLIVLLLVALFGGFGGSRW